jgi:(1->4)-alpha-D-glucan 1-alpha-D-glucosylmutase
MEDPRVFAEAHRLVLALVREGRVGGLRIDHPDGLYDPTAYFRRLQAAAVTERASARAAGRGEPLGAEERAALERRVADGMASGELPARPFYVVAEKILSPGERMPSSWAIDGTTGYEFLVAASGLFVDPDQERAFTTLYARFARRREPYREVAWRNKELVTSSSMAAEINMLAHRLNRISETNRRTRDFTLNDITRALVQFVALFPVYRTYVAPDGAVHDRDREYVERTVARARRRSPVFDPSIYDFLRDVLLLRYPAGLSDAERRDWLEFTLKLQQVTGPVTAKALEDTAFYVYLRLVALNEVGGEPDEFGTRPEAFHALNAARARDWPGSLSATSTHDTKRSEDVRTRIAALSEIPREWRGRLARWARLDRRHRTDDAEDRPAPDRNDEYLLYQTIVGTFPEDARPGTAAWEDWVGRVQRYMEKAIREAKVHTSWTNPSAEYEQSTRDFVAAALGAPALQDDLAPFAARIAAAARLSSLAQVALKLASPGVADVYQGCELWDLSLVDPDNRRPVDFGLRSRLLAAISERLAAGPAARARLAREVSGDEGLRDGRAKLLLLREGLRLRRARPALFLEGAYRPLAPEGPHAAHVVAFARSLGGDALLCVVPRLVLRMRDESRGEVAWRARLPLPPDLRREWVDVVTGERRGGEALEAADLFAAFPVALLLSTEGS